MSYWEQWMWKPQGVWLRKAMFQVHLWSGIILGLYVLLVSVTGSIVVYRNELYEWSTPTPITLTASGPRLTDEQLTEAALRAHPGYRVLSIGGGDTPTEPRNISFDDSGVRRDRLFNPYTGEDLGDPVTLGFRAVSKLLELHDDLLGGSTGRSINGIAALLLLVIVFTGIIVWWPGIKAWSRSLTLHRGVGWRRFTWDLHSAVGFWTLGIIVMFCLSGAYLGNPGPIQDFIDRINPPTEANAGNRIIDHVIYWLAYLHFGRINGIGIPCKGPGLCDQATKFVWAVAGLAPALMFVTGALMWWNRVVRKKFKRA